MVKKGVQVIELCGGFEIKDMKEIISSIEGKVPVGLVEFAASEKLKLRKIKY